MVPERRKLSVREYISELIEKRKIEDRPNIKGFLPLQAINVIEENKRFFIARTQAMHGEQQLGSQIYNYCFDVDFVYFPKNLGHAEIFSKSTVERFGPQDEFPGSVADLSLSYDHQVLRLNYLQYCFIHGSPKELTRTLAAKYQGAGYHLLRCLFNSEMIGFVDKIVFSQLIMDTERNRVALERILQEEQPILSDFERSDEYQLRRRKSNF